MSRVHLQSVAGAAADCRDLPWEAGPATLRDLRARARFGSKGPGTDTWFARRGALPSVNRRVPLGGARRLRLGTRDIMVRADPESSAPVEAIRADWEGGGESGREETRAWLRRGGRPRSTAQAA